MGRLSNGELATGPATIEVEKQTQRFEQLVRKACEEEGVAPPRAIRLQTTKRGLRGNAGAVRFGKMGHGYLAASYSLVEDLTDDELCLVIRHELAHYRHAEARWAPLQGAAFLSPVLVYLYGYPLNHLVGKEWTLTLYFMAIAAHVLAFKSQRFFEGRADRESIRSRADGVVAQRALLKDSTLKRRHELGATGDDAEKVIEEFQAEIAVKPTLTVALFNLIWGTHPLLRQRLATFENIASRCPQ